jgi:hypothetical protein
MPPGISRKNTDVGRRSVPRRLCSLINFNTRKNTKRLDQIACGKPGPGRKPHPNKANGLPARMGTDA